MARKQDILPYRIFVGDRPLEDLTAEEREAFSKQTAQRIGDALNNYYSHHPEEYIQYVKAQEARERG